MKIILSFLVVFCYTLSWAQEIDKNYPELTNQAEISVLTVGTGSEVYTLFGHTALRIYDPLMRIDRVYNYGLFDFRTPNFLSKFIKGDLLYFAGIDDYSDFVYGYALEDRPVYEQQLYLTDHQKQELWQLANRSLEEGYKFYNYKFIHQNCTTKVVDLINAVLAKPVKVEISQDTYRGILNKSLQGHYFEKLGINLLFSSKLDEKPKLLFLPNTFMDGLAATTVEGMPLVAKTTVIYEKKQMENSAWWNSYAFFSTLLLIVAFLMRFNWVRTLYFIVMGLLGILLLFVSFYSSHIELANNDTFLLCNPLMLLFPWLVKTGKFGKTQIGFCTFLGLCILLFIILNVTSEKLTLTLPIVLLNLWALFVVFRTARVRRLEKKD